MSCEQGRGVPMRSSLGVVKEGELPSKVRLVFSFVDG